MHWDKCQGCERCRWDYQWRANGCSSNLCASFSLTHRLPLEAPLTSLRDWGLFTDHWLNASFSFPPAFPWSYEQNWGHCQAAFELFINRPNEKMNKTRKTLLPSALLFLSESLLTPPPPFPPINLNCGWVLWVFNISWLSLKGGVLICQHNVSFL